MVFEGHVGEGTPRCIAVWGILVLWLLPSVFADVKSTSGRLDFLLSGQSDTVMTLSSSGLGLGAEPSANLHVAGNASVTQRLGIAVAQPSSNLHISGSMALVPQRVTGNATISQGSMVLADTSLGNMVLSLPDAASHSGQMFKVKKIAQAHCLSIAGGGNLIDGRTSLSFSAGNMECITLISNGSQWYSTDLYAPGGSVDGFSSNLIGYWPLDETSGTVAHDLSVSQRHGVLKSSSFASKSVVGRSGKALYLDGNYDYLNLSSHGITLSANMTLSLWLKLNVEIGTGSHSIYPGIVSRSASGSFDNYISFQSGNLIRTEDSGNVFRSSTSSAIVRSYEWIHVALTITETGLVLFYIDGVAHGSNSVTSSHYSLNYFGMGYGGASNDGSFLGAMDEIRLYNKSLSASEILELATMGGNVAL